jgi:hypothetical protein
MAQLKDMMKEQFLLILLDEERAVQAIPKLLAGHTEERRIALEALHRMIAARGVLPEEGKRRLNRMEALFDIKLEKPAREEPVHA